MLNMTKAAGRGFKAAKEADLKVGKLAKIRVRNNPILYTGRITSEDYDGKGLRVMTAVGGFFRSEMTKIFVHDGRLTKAAALADHAARLAMAKRLKAEGVDISLLRI